MTAIEANFNEPNTLATKVQNFFERAIIVGAGTIIIIRTPYDFMEETQRRRNFKEELAKKEQYGSILFSESRYISPNREAIKNHIEQPIVGLIAIYQGFTGDLD